ncbi:MAG: carboxylating nicotinate-nucleotide diphosphorylase [Proteobacteria bacterium]|jgi:nicotinate-nucleotide pyrophosphorylase (carboxylating)|nr:carboxylating nicotinate-nucleotide diphosphorylase [Pseudomonadota bacterium]
MAPIHAIQLTPVITRALEEDWGSGDWTTDICVPAQTQASAKIIAKESTLVAGVEVARATFLLVDPTLKVDLKVDNGAALNSGDVILEVSGNARSILKGERVALNFLGRMCGIATLTRTFVNELSGTKAQLLDTRKTTPGLRLLEKSATVVGGARNHRMCLTDGVIVKENHIRAAGGISKAVARLLESLPPTLKIEVETSNLDEVQEALDAGADLIMLDNMSLAQMALAVRTVRGRALLEASGNVRQDTVRKIAETGVDFISTGAIIHSARWSDLSLLFNI